MLSSRRRFNFAMLAAAVLSTGACAPFEPSPRLQAEQLVDQAVATVERFQNVESLKKFAAFLPDAQAVAIFPRIIKAGFFVGGEAGNGLLMARSATKGWSAPVFYTLGAGSFGIQFGAQDTEVILILRSRGALNAVLKDQAKFGADAGFTVGLYGVGAEASTTTNLGADVIAFANSRLGGYLGASFEGAV
ncbi:MAG: lipid-binding SYLF domain-containing protein, partial [Proteobacteria bacterium]|nr:lipid-binding SYLF domain-containing protein [Pseudomonadota bacterium]